MVTVASCYLLSGFHSSKSSDFILKDPISCFLILLLILVLVQNVECSFLLAHFVAKIFYIASHGPTK